MNGPVHSCLLEDIAVAGLGYKSLQNDFFYLDSEIVDHYEIEKEFLRPLFKLKDLSASDYLQESKAQTWVFYCSEGEADLKGTGALKYIRAMENRPCAEKKQSNEPKTMREALEAQSGGIWYGPKAILHSETIWIRKAFNTVFSPFIFGTPKAVDQRCNFIRPKAIDWKALAALLTSSLFTLSAESHGATSLGAGALELATTQLPFVRVPDLRMMNQGDLKELASLGSAVWAAESPIDWLKDDPKIHLQALDAWLLAKMHRPQLQSRLYSDIKEMIGRRLGMAKGKGVTRKRNVVVNIGKISEGIAAAVKPLLDGRRFPENFSGESGSVTYQFPKQLTLEVRKMLGVELVSVTSSTGENIFDHEVPSPVGQVIGKALLLGRRKFSCPTSTEAATEAMNAFYPWIEGILAKISEMCTQSSVGTKYEGQVRSTVLKDLGLHPAIADLEFYGKIDLP